MSRVPRFPAYPAKKHKSGQARIKIATKTYYLGRHGSQESRIEYARLAAEFAKGEPIRPKLPNKAGAVTIAFVVASWAAAEPRGPAHKEVRGMTRACVPLERLFGTTRADEFSVMRLQAVQAAMIDGSWMTIEERQAGEKGTSLFSGTSGRGGP